MTDIDLEIQKALKQEDREIYNQFEELGLVGQLKAVLQGKNGWISVTSMVIGTIMNFGFFYAAWKFFTVTGIEAKAGWGAVAWSLATMVAYMKISIWMRMESNRVIRELKRLELQVLRLQKKD